MGISLAVGRLTLDQVAEVRILHPQPISPQTGCMLFASCSRRCVQLFCPSHDVLATSIYLVLAAGFSWSTGELILILFTPNPNV